MIQSGFAFVQMSLSLSSMLPPKVVHIYNLKLTLISTKLLIAELLCPALHSDVVSDFISQKERLYVLQNVQNLLSKAIAKGQNNFSDAAETKSLLSSIETIYECISHEVDDLSAERFAAVEAAESIDTPQLRQKEKESCEIEIDQMVSCIMQTEIPDDQEEAEKRSSILQLARKKIMKFEAFSNRLLTRYLSVIESEQRKSCEMREIAESTEVRFSYSLVF